MLYDGVKELASKLAVDTAILHLGGEGWKHFGEGRDAIERELAGAPADVRERFNWLPIGVG